MARVNGTKQRAKLSRTSRAESDSRAFARYESRVQVIGANLRDRAIGRDRDQRLIEFGKVRSVKVIAYLFSDGGCGETMRGMVGRLLGCSDGNLSLGNLRAAMWR